MKVSNTVQTHAQRTHSENFFNYQNNQNLWDSAESVIYKTYVPLKNMLERNDQKIMK